MEECLRVLASGLSIQTPSEEGREFKPASQEQMDAFTDAMRKHLIARGKTREYGDIITYDYYRAKIRGGMRRHDEREVEGPNANLGEVLSKLPKLSDGEHYVFPVPTFVSFQIVGKFGDGSGFSLVKACDWVRAKI